MYRQVSHPLLARSEGANLAFRLKKRRTGSDPGDLGGRG